MPSSPARARAGGPRAPVAGVAGAALHHAAALTSEAVAPGAALELRRDPENPHDPNAIAVHGGGAQVGWVPKKLAAELAREIEAGRPWSAVVLREQRDSPREARRGLTMLLAPADGIELRVVPDRGVAARQVAVGWPHTSPHM